MTETYESLHPEQDIKNLSLLENLTILVVDDNADNLMLLKIILEINSAKVITASSAASAWQIIKEERLNLLISDISMPEEDGCSLIQRIREFPNSENQKILAIALSANDEYELQQLALKAGFEIYLTKPILPDKLIASIEELFKK